MCRLPIEQLNKRTAGEKQSWLWKMNKDIRQANYDSVKGCKFIE